MIGVPEGSPLVVDVRLESVTEGVLVTGTVTGTVTGECGRCLTGFTEDLAVDFVELFAYPDSATEETTDPDEVPRLDGDHLDLEPVVRDAVVLSLPLTPLCRPDCGGLCPECGERLDDLPEDHTHPSSTRAGPLLPSGSARRPTQHVPTVDPESGVIAVAVPKRKMSRANTRARRSQWKTSAPTLVTCPNRACGQPKLPHTACSNCGQYDGRQVLAV